MSASHVFVDESKRSGYLLVAVVVLPADLDPIRKVLRGLVLPGQRRLHMKDESDPRKRSIASTVAAIEIQAIVYDAGTRYRTERERRAACLSALVPDIANRGAEMLVLEMDDTLASADRRLLYRASRDAGCSELRYQHRRAAAEPLLALPDAIAWCWAKGGHWRNRIASAVTDVRQL